MNIIFRLFVIVFIVGTALVVTGESKMNTPERQKILDQKLVNIMSSDKYLHGRASEMKRVIKAGAGITNENIEWVFDEWLSSAQRRDGDFSLIHFTPDMLSEENKDKFNKAILGINREEVIDKLNALNVVIDHSPEKITGVFRGLVNPKFDMFHKSDMAIHWLEYFLSREKTDVNAFKRSDPMSIAIISHNYDVAKLLIKYGYISNDKHFEYIQEERAEVKRDVGDTDTVDQKGALGALSKIEALLMDNINNKVSEPPPSRGFFD